MDGRTDRHSYWRKKSTVAAATANNQRIPTDIVTIQQTSDSEKIKLKIKTLKQPTETHALYPVDIRMCMQPYNQLSRQHVILP